MYSTAIELAVATLVAIVCFLLSRYIYRARPSILAATLFGLSGGFGGAFIGLLLADISIDLHRLSPDAKWVVMSFFATPFALVMLSWYGRGILKA
jgi:hypothetical protein